MTTEADRINARIADEAQEISRTRIDLDAFLALSSEDRAARWRQWPSSAKTDAIIQQLGRAGLDWTAELVAHWTKHYDAKYGVSDLVVPPAADILAVAKERSDLAQQHGDYAGAAQLNRLRVNVQRGAHLSFHLGDLLVQSVNNPGQVYAVNRRGCTCPNGQAGRSQCWHVALFDLLMDMLDERAATADMDADRAAEREASAALGRRLCAARSRVMQEAA